MYLICVGNQTMTCTPLCNVRVRLCVSVCVGLQLAVKPFSKLSFLVCMSIPNTVDIT